MSSWLQCQAVFEIRAAIVDETQKEIVRDVKKMFMPLPTGSEGPLDIRVNLRRRHCTHCADVVVTGGIRDIDSYTPLYNWLDNIQAKAREGGRYRIENGVFRADVSYLECIFGVFHQGFWEITNSRFRKNPYL